MGLGWSGRVYGARIGHIPGGGRQPLREGGPISHEARPSKFLQPPPQPPPPTARVGVEEGHYSGSECRVHGLGV